MSFVYRRHAVGKFPYKADCCFKAANFRFCKASTDVISFFFHFRQCKWAFNSLVKHEMTLRQQPWHSKSTVFLWHANPSSDTQIKPSLTVNRSSSQKHCNTSTFRRVRFSPLEVALTGFVAWRRNVVWKYMFHIFRHRWCMPLIFKCFYSFCALWIEYKIYCVDHLIRHCCQLTRHFRKGDK